MILELIVVLMHLWVKPSFTSVRIHEIVEIPVPVSGTSITNTLDTQTVIF